MVNRQIIRVGVKNFPPAHGGVEKTTSLIVDELKRDFSFDIFTEWENELPPPDGVKVHVLSKGFFAAIRQIKAAVVDKKTTILHFQREPMVPYALVFSLMGYKTVVSIHGCAWRLKKWNPAIRLAFFLFNVLACNFATRTFYVGETDRKLFARLSFRKIYHIPNGVLPCSCLDAPRTGDMVFVGRMGVEKNLEAIIDNAEKSGRSLDLYGAFDARHSAYEKLIRGKLASCKHCTWHGPVTPDKLYGELCKYKYFVNISFSEGMPVAVLEAAACGLRLYVSDIPQHRCLGFEDVRFFNPYSFSFPAADASASYSKANVEKVGQSYLISAVAKQYKRLYESI